MYFEFVLVIHVVLCFLLIGIILLQQGKGSDMGASFGAGASGTVFGSSGSGNFLTKTTAILATAFFVTSILLGYLHSSSKNTALQSDVDTNINFIP